MTDKHTKPTLGFLFCLVAATSLVACNGADENRAPAAADKGAKASEPSAAIIRLKSYLQKQPQSGPARLALGKALLATGDAAAAEAEFRRALELVGDSDEVLPALARSLLHQRKFPALLALEEGTLPADAKAAAELLTTLAQARQAQADEPKAKTLIAQALRSDPQYAPALVMDVRLSAATGSVKEALTRAEALARQYPKDAEVVLLLADALTASGDKSAVNNYEQVLALDPLSEAAHGGLIRWALRERDYERAAARAQAMKKALPGRSLPVYYDALVAYSSGKLERAREQTQQLLKAPEPGPLVRMLAGFIEQRLGAYTQAEALLARALAAMPDNLELRRELAAVQTQLNQPDAALQILKPALTASLADPATWLVAGRVYTMLGDFKAADAAYARAKAVQPKDGVVQLESARSLFARGNEEAGLLELQAAAQGPEATQALLDLIPALMRRQDFAAALAAVDRLEQLTPKGPQPELLRGQILQDRGDLAGARAAFEKALKKDPRFVLAVERLARLDLADQRYEDARLRYLAFLKANPQSASAMLALAELARIDGSGPAQVDAWLDKAVQAHPLDAQTWATAVLIDRRTGLTSRWLNRVQRATAALPADVELQAELSRASRASGNLNEAKAAIGRAIALQPKSAQLRLLQADVLAGTGDLAGARNAVDQARMLAPQSFDVERAHVLMLVKEGKLDDALGAAQQRKKRMPRDVDSLLLEADIRAIKGETKPTLALLREALALSKASHVASRVSDELRRTGASAAATAFEQDWLRNNPRDLEFMGYAAQQASVRGDKERAEELYRKVVALQPQAALSLNNLATLLLGSKPEEALSLAQRAVQLMPNAPPILDTLAQAQAAAGKVNFAIRVQAKAIELDPESIALRLTLAKLQIQAGEKEKARQELRRISEKTSAKAVADEVNVLLRELER